MTTISNPRSFLHLDMDAFYPSVEVLDDPTLRGKPVIVGGSIRGVVASASYEAREFGVRSAMPIARARKLCPQAVCLPVRMSRYQEISREVFGIFSRFSPKCEPLSIDEAFLDVTGTERLFGTPEAIVREIKQCVVSEIGLTVSAGVAPNKFLAKIASDLDKPDGLTVVPHAEIESFLHPLPIGKLWGVGEVTQKALFSMGVRTIGQLARVPRTTLEGRFGKHGIHLHLLSQGIDDREVETERGVKSIGHEDTYAQDIVNIDALRKELLSLAVRVSRRLRSQELEGRTLTAKVKYNNFQQVTRSVTLDEATDDGSALFRNACRLLEKTEAGRRPVRLLGISVSNLQPQGQPRQAGLFDDARKPRKREELNRALDRIYGKFGEEAILPGTLFEEDEKR